MKNGILLVLLALAVVSCRTRDIRTITVDVPGMKNQACADIVLNAISKTRGVRGDLTVVDLERRTVSVAYDSLQLSVKNVEFDIAAAGFQANEVPADPKGAQNLPPECR